MVRTFQLDHFTLLVCGNALLLAMALTLVSVSVSARAGPAARALHVWIVSLILFPGAGIVFLFDSWSKPASVGFPPVSASLVGVLICVTCMQQLAMQQISRGGVTWRRVIVGGLAILGVGVTVASMLPSSQARAGLIAASRILIPLFTVVRLRPLIRGSRGAGIVWVVTVVNSIANLAVPQLAGERTELMPVYGMCFDITSVFLCTLGLLLWYQEHVEHRLTQTAMTDVLTGVLNRYGLMSRLEQELSRAQRNGRAISVVLCDLDHFKRVNDVHGHAMGDAVLQNFAQHTSDLIRAQDVFGRWGGEEFLLILPETSLEQASKAAERVRQAQARAQEGLPLVTMSAGVASTPSESGDFCNAAELLARADDLLYLAKEMRNCIVSRAPLPLEPARVA